MNGRFVREDAIRSIIDNQRDRYCVLYGDAYHNIAIFTEVGLAWDLIHTILNGQGQTLSQEQKMSRDCTKSLCREKK